MSMKLFSRRSLWILPVLLLSLLVFAACGSDPPTGRGPATVDNDWTWSMLESPQTGKCYEIVTKNEGSGHRGYMGMGAEAPCQLMKDR